LLQHETSREISPISGGAAAIGRYSAVMKSEPNMTANVIITDDENTAITEDGLVLKYFAEIRKLNVKNQTWVDGRYTSWQICRIMRRDFNLVSKTMFTRCSRPEVKLQFRDLLAELRLRADLMASASLCFECDPQAEVKQVPVCLVAPEAASLFRALAIADGAFARYNFAAKRGAIFVERINGEFARDFLYAYSMFKAFAVQRKDSKPAEQLGAELGVL
jgi:hypothetical protein